MTGELRDPTLLMLHLEMFEGPLDLLLHLIKKQNIDIFDIPIQQIARDFQSYLEVIHDLDLDRAGEFLAMAAELARIKSRLLLPQPKAEEGAEQEDPRADLVRRLVEHQQIREAAQHLEGRTALGRDVFVRGVSPGRWLPDPPLETDVSPVELFQALRRVLKRATKLSPSHRIRSEPMSVAERMGQLLDLCQEGAILRFEELFAGGLDRMEIVVTFLALLELTRLRQLKLHQSEETGELSIERLAVVEETSWDEEESQEESQEAAEEFPLEEREGRADRGDGVE